MDCPSPHLQRLLSACQYHQAGERRMEALQQSNYAENHTEGRSSQDIPLMSSISEPTSINTPRRLQSSAKKVGRPRLDGNDSTILSEERRKQVRRAQKTYRLKKEAHVENMTARVSELENKLSRMAHSLSDLYEISRKSNLDTTHPELFEHVHDICARFGLDSQPSLSQSRATPKYEARQLRYEASPAEDIALEAILGYCHTSNSDRNDPNESTESQPASPQLPHAKYQPPAPGQETSRIGNTRLVIEDIERPLGSDSNYTYCFQETTLSRKLHRYCLEQAYRLFCDPRSNPTTIYQIFRLVPCIQNKARMYPYFKQLITSGADDPLELFTLPFYCIGGAGTHYPATDYLGNPVYPSKMRLPRRRLGLFPFSESESGPGIGVSDQERLEVFGLGGAWFDCRDVEGYLKEQGVDVQKSALFADVALLQSTSTQSSELQMNREEDERRPNTSDGKSPSMVTRDVEQESLFQLPSRYILDIECFFKRLCQGLVILGRAPGFRKRDVEIAFNSALRMAVI
ncbi:hypothetical protein FQN50_007772 [Emmonsiellopsis sp. PD_5]|nr:hypothetical protein FQN50_007772 [Emmonsiellopsis sp. PD_5]